LIAPTGEYKLYLKAKGYNTKYISKEIKLGFVEEIDQKLLPVRFNCGITAGPTYINNLFTTMINLDLGVDIASKHYIGISGSGLTYERNIQTYTKDTLIKDSLETIVRLYRTASFLGIGITYGYRGFNFWKVLTLIPKISLGYWKYENEYDLHESIDNIRTPQLDNIPAPRSYTSVPDRQHIDRYFFKPGVELQIGCRVVGFRIHTDMFIGKNIGPLGINSGVLFRIL
jgi:hypothetical protein